jgi:predicted DsbA family dithiol-disulfide isomerase
MSHLHRLVIASVAASLLVSYRGIAGPLPPTDAPADPAANLEVAVIGKQRFTFEQLPENVRTELDNSRQRYEERLRQLAIDYRRARAAIIENATNTFVDARLVQAEAAKRHLTVLELVKQVKNPEVTDADIHAFYEQNRQWIKEPYASAQIKITPYLMEQAQERGKRTYLTALRKKYSARVLIEPDRDEVAAEGPSRGPQDARVTIVEFADFECPFCGRMEPVFRQVLQQYPHDVRLVFRQMPLPDLHPNAMHAAQASLCAGQQRRFWEMHDAMFANQAALDEAGITQTATRLGLEAQPFTDCLNSAPVSAAIKADTDAGNALGVNGTPGIFVNGRFFGGAVPYEALAAVIEDELQRSTSRDATSAMR